MARKIVKRKARSPKTTAIVPAQRNEAEEPDNLSARTELPLAFIATASKLSLQQFWLNRLGSADGFQRAAAEAIRSAVAELAAAHLARLGIDGVLEQTELPKNEADEKFSDAQRAFLRIRASAILEQEGGQFQPYFQPKPLSDAVMRQCRADGRKMWRFYYKLYGCKDCKTVRREHAALGYCKRCYGKIASRWRGIVKYPAQFIDEG